MAIAHSANALGQTHDLVEHLQRVAELAAGFAAKFGAGHDLERFHLAFQDYLKAQTDADLLPIVQVAIPLPHSNRPIRGASVRCLNRR